jgi:hypothetical protein
MIDQLEPRRMLRRKDKTMRISKTYKRFARLRIGICALFMLALFSVPALSDGLATAPSSQPISPESARAKFDAAVAHARQAYVGDLKIALKAAMQPRI